MFKGAASWDTLKIPIRRYFGSVSSLTLIHMAYLFY
jgi:hypothetical protein